MNLVHLSTLFLFFSGAASLIYQVTWVRLLSLSIGSTSVSVSIVLATFFFGLALGSFLTTRLPSHFLKNTTPYVIVEAVIGVSALLLLPLLLSLDQLVAMWPALGQVFVFKLGLVVAILALPSICIGATYPLMVSIVVREQSEVGVKLGWLYSVNTFGAVAGAAGSGFVLIPLWGLDGAIYFACMLNFFVVALGLIYRNRFSFPPFPSSPEMTKPRIAPISVGPDNKGKVLAILFVTGMVALACEVAWTKYLSIFTHTTIYGFSAILTVFLIGIATGAWFIKQRIDQMKRPLSWVVLLLSLLAVSLILARVGLEYLPALYGSITSPGGSAVGDALVKYSLILLLLFVPAALLGALFTLNIRLYCGPVESVHNKAGVAYAVNTIGGITGSLLAGLWLIPVYGSDLVLSIAPLLVMGIVLILFLQLETKWQRRSVLAVMVITLVGVIYLPHLDFRHMILESRYYFDHDRSIEQPPEFSYLKEGRSSVVSVTTYDDRRFRLQNNSLPEALVTPPDPFAWLSETLLGLMPYLLHEDPNEIFIVGLGAGNTLSAAALAPSKSIRVIELEPAVEEATRVIFGGEIDALNDPRVELVFDDARHRLLIEGKNYDAIISQPSHPWLAGSGNLFTKEYFELVASRLNEGGISVQWLNLVNMDATTLRSIFKSYFTVFPYGMTFMVRYESSLILVGANTPLKFNYEMMHARINEPSIRNVLKNWGLITPYELYRYFSLSHAEALAAAGAIEANRDTNLIPEVRLAWLNQRPSGEEGTIELLGSHFKLDILKYLMDGQRARQTGPFAQYLLFKNDQFRYDLLMQRLQKSSE